MVNDLEISRRAKLKHIESIGLEAGIPKKYLELYGDYKAKVSLDFLRSIKRKGKGRYIVVTGITPTHLGEGKTVTTIGLSMALNRMGKPSIACIRQPSLGPFFGVKGGGVGGGRSQVLPMEDINLHLTGDIHAVSQAHNLASSFLDNHLYRGNRLNVDPERVYWRRVIDLNDRSLRNIVIAAGGGEFGVERRTGFDITASSELMAILALTDSLPDLKSRLARIILALSNTGKTVTCEDIKAAGSMTLILKDAIKPNLVQTIENTPAFIHTGPFGNITHGNSSIIADRMALSVSDYVVTESGFGADCGLEKFVNIKCRASGLVPDVAVLVCSIRALKIHSGMYKMTVGRPFDKDMTRESLGAVEMGCANLEKQIENVRIYGIPCVVGINKFRTDTDKEINMVKKIALERGAFHCVISDLYGRGSKGGLDLAKAVEDAGRAKSRFKFLYPADMPIKEKVETIARNIYGAKDVHYHPKAESDIAAFTKLGLGRLPVCMTKTHLSLSHDPKLKGAPKDFILPVMDVRPSVGAGFLYALCGKILTMPSLPSRPVGEHIDVDAKGRMKWVV